MNHAQFWGGAAAPYEIEQSLRFDGSAGKLTRTNPASSGITNAYKWSYSFWIKHSDVSSSGTVEQPLLSGGNTSGAGRTFCGWGYTSSGRFWIGNYTGADYRPDIRPTDRVWRDPGAWEHFMLVYDTSESVNTDRIKIYSNGVRWNPTGGVGSTISSTQLFYAVNYASKASNIGYDNILNKYFDGYMAEVHFVDGQALDQYDFGEFDSSGVWRPKRYTGTYGLNGHYLKFDPSATNGIGHDHSGNGNNFTATGFTTSGTGTDVMSDTPTTNWCTLNPLDAGTSGMLSDGNLIFNLGSGSDYIVRATQGMSSGKWYAEWTYNSGVNSYVGIASYAANLSGYLGQDQYGYAYDHAGDKYNNNSGTSYGATYTHGDVIGIAFDADAGSLTFYKNGTSQGTAFTGLSNFPYFFAHGANNCNGTFNFGQHDFSYTPPTNFLPLNTSNLPAPDIADGSDYFNTVLYTGTGSTQSITGVGFQPDFVWMKARNGAFQHGQFDAVRGTGKGLVSNSTAAEGTYSAANSFDTDGFTNGTDYNGSGTTYVAWNWLAGGSGSSNTDGSITSTVSANPSAGFSIVSYTANNVAGATVGHGLGVAPSFAIFKNRDSAYNWTIFHKSLNTASGEILLFTTAAAQTSSQQFNSTAPTSTVFTLGSGGNTNSNSGDDIIAYCFAEVEGYSKFGSYTGNGSSDGPFVYTGMAPAFILVKQSSGGENWLIFDTTRKTYNEIDTTLSPNVSSAEVTNSTNEYDILSNGFKARNSSAGVNQSGQTYIFAAFSENPFGGSGVSPATAR